ncbi:MAG: sugar ABC transporter substrate-binding protein, partial [Firmicutes bacterium]|nr:sugar ABC transporter substrate-binding protein [Bacillota bacterium]
LLGIGATAAQATDVDNVTGKTVYFINAGPDDYYAQFGDAFKAIGEAVGLTIKELNSDYNPEQELANVQDAISAGADAIAVITAGAAGSAASIAAANDANVPIFFIAGRPELQEGTELNGHVTDNFVMMGYMVGKWVAENYPEAQCVNIPGFLGQGPAEGEIVGFDMALEEAGMKPAIMTKSSEWQRTLAIPITQDLIASGQEFDVVFACNEETYFGVKQVFEELGITDKVLVSNNGKDDVWPDLVSGELAATVPNPPSLNADICIQQIIRYFNGEDFVRYLQIKPPFVLTGENVGQAIPWTVSDYLAGRAANTFQWDLAAYEAAFEENKDEFAAFDAKLAEYLDAH